MVPPMVASVVPLDTTVAAAPSAAVPPVRRLSRRPSAGEVVLAYLAEQVSAMRERERAVRAEEPDAVHQMRVALRRLRAALRTFGTVLDRERTRPVADELKWLAGVLGAARDQEVLQERIERRLAATAPEQLLGAVAARLTEQFARDHADARAGYLREFDADRYDVLFRSLEALVAAPPLTRRAAERGARVLPPLVGRAYRDLDRAVARARAQPPGPERDLAMHDARKAAKRGRYAVDATMPVVDKAAKKLVKHTKALQELLGEHRDSIVARGFLRSLGARAHLAGRNGFTYGLWYAQEEFAAARAEGELPAAWRRASRPRDRRWLASR